MAGILELQRLTCPFGDLAAIDDLAFAMLPRAIRVDPAVFQIMSGMTFTVIIALELKRSLLVLAERGATVVQVPT